jgi:hypothetical protein
MNFLSSLPLFHPSTVQRAPTPTSVPAPVIGNLGVVNIKELISPGSYALNPTPELEDENPVLRNLYGTTLMTYLFFSKKNIESIQNLIKMLVYRYMNYVVDDQSPTDLIIVMRSMFLQYCNNPLEILPDMSPEQKKKSLADHTAEVARLNQMVVSEVVPLVVSQLQAYLDYLRDANQPLQALPPPINDSIKGQRQYKSVTSVLAGGTF